MVSKSQSYYLIQIGTLVGIPIAAAIPFWYIVLASQNSFFRAFMATTYSVQGLAMLSIAYVFELPFLLYLAYLFVNTTQDPVTLFYSDSLSEANPRVQKLMGDAAWKMGLETRPKTYFVGLPVCLSIGTEKNATLFLWDRIGKWDDDQIRNLITHELWHVRSDIETASLVMTQNVEAFLAAASSLALAFFGLIASLAEMATGLGGFSEHGGIATPLAYASVAALFACLFSLLLAYFGYLRPAGMSWLMKNAFREFLADELGAVCTGQPRVMAQTIRKFAAESISQSLPSLRGPRNSFQLNFVESRNADENAKGFADWHSLFGKIKWGASHPSLFARFAFLYLIQHALDKSISIVIMKKIPVEDLESYFYAHYNTITFGGAIYHVYNTFGPLVHGIPKENRLKLWDYLVSNQNEINLRKASVVSSISLEETFSLFMILFAAKAIGVIQPELAFEKVKAFSQYSS